MCVRLLIKAKENAIRVTNFLKIRFSAPSGEPDFFEIRYLSCILGNVVSLVAFYVQPMVQH